MLGKSSMVCQTHSNFLSLWLNLFIRQTFLPTIFDSSIHCTFLLYVAVFYIPAYFKCCIKIIERELRIGTLAVCVVNKEYMIYSSYIFGFVLLSYLNKLTSMNSFSVDLCTSSSDNGGSCNSLNSP